MNDDTKSGIRGWAESLTGGAARQMGRGAMVLHWVGWVAVMAGLGLVAGCRTISPGGVPSIETTLTAGGNAQLGSDVFPAQELAEHLKSAGAGRATAIFLVIPRDMNQSTLSGFSRELRKAGFQKIIFKRPMKPDASVHPKEGIP